eukprot:COSAG06_NODE_47622_length_338_cov_0.627615_2_plen_49_part_01
MCSAVPPRSVAVRGVYLQNKMVDHGKQISVSEVDNTRDETMHAALRQGS